MSDVKCPLKITVGPKGITVSGDLAKQRWRPELIHGVRLCEGQMHKLIHMWEEWTVREGVSFFLNFKSGRYLTSDAGEELLDRKMKMKDRVWAAQGPRKVAGHVIQRQRRRAQIRTAGRRHTTEEDWRSL